jgi:hypothetical protein
MSEINITMNRWVAMDKRGYVLCEYNPNPGLSYHLGDLRFEVLGDYCDVISGTKRREIMEHIRKWNKECKPAFKCEPVKVTVIIKEAKK